MTTDSSFGAMTLASLNAATPPDIQVTSIRVGETPAGGLMITVRGTGPVADQETPGDAFDVRIVGLTIAPDSDAAWGTADKAVALVLEGLRI